MSELAETFSIYRQQRKIIKRSYLDYAEKMIPKLGVSFKELPNGHWQVGDFDFWATTGLFINRKTKKRGRGISNLIKNIELDL